jgi:hypothetical protein
MADDLQENVPEDYALIRKRILSDYLTTVTDLRQAIKLLQEERDALLDYIQDLNHDSEEHIKASTKLMERHKLVEEENKILLQENRDLMEAAKMCGVLKLNSGGIN